MNGEATHRDQSGEVLRERVRLAFRQLPTVQATSVVVAVVLCFAVRNISPVANIVLWLACIALVVVLRITLSVRFRKVRETAFDGAVWKNAFLLSSLFSGIIWGSSAFLIFPAGNMALVALFVLVIASLAASTMVSHASLRFGPVAWAAPALLQYALRCFIESGEIGYMIGALIVLYLFTIVRYSFHQNRMISDAIAFKFRNLDLVEELRKVNEDLNKDILDRKRAEQTLRLLEKAVDTTAIGITISDRENVIRYVNAAEAAMHVYRKEDLIGRNISVFAPVRLRRTMNAEKMKTISSWSRESVNVRSDGTIFPVSLVSDVVLDDHGEPLGIVTACEDITRRKQMEAELHRAKEAAEKASAAKSEFLASMSHEFRTPLNGILGYAQMLLSDPDLRPRDADALRTISSSGEHLLALISDILDMSLIEAGMIAIREAPFNLSSVVYEVFDSFRIAAREKKLEFTCRVDDDVPKVVRGDEKRLRQVLTNILSNAVKFTEAGRVSLHIFRTGNQITFRIDDTGAGIDPADMHKIFEPFSQAGDGAKRNEGSGLGLAISKRMLDLMGGSIQAESVPGTGSRFRFDIDLSEVAESVSDSGMLHLRIGGYEGRRRRILVVDDVAVNRTVCVNMLRRYGFEMSEAQHGEEAVAKALDERPDCILMDIVMPGMDGLEATRRIRQEASLQGIAIIAVSAAVFDSDKDACFKSGCDDFEEKPIQWSRMLDKIGRCLGLTWIFRDG